LPYTIEIGFQRLAKDSLIGGVDAWGEKNGKTAEQRAWYAHDRLMREKIVLHDLGTWSHFVADGSMPLHASVHYNGWGKYPNPEGFTDAKIHSPFESEMVHGNIAEKDIAGAMPLTVTANAPSGSHGGLSHRQPSRSRAALRLESRSASPRRRRKATPSSPRNSDAVRPNCAT